MPLGRAVFDVALGLDAGMRLLLLQRRVESGGLGRLDDPANFQQFSGQIRRHRGLLSRRGAREKYGGNRGGPFQAHHPKSPAVSGHLVQHGQSGPRFVLISP
jgi:hypothetical protein